MTPSPRSRRQRREDTLHRLAHDIDAWVATADPDSGTPYLVPLSFLWEGDTLLLSTSATTPTGRNLRTAGTVRLGLGSTRDLVLIDGTVQTWEPAEISGALGDAFAAKTGFDPRRLTSRYLYFRVRPVRIQAWREENEIAGRDLMRDGVWLPAG